MFDDPFGVGVASFPLPPPGLASTIRPGFVVAIPVRDEEERLLACLRALARQRAGRGGRFRPRWSALSYSPTIAPIRVRASLEVLERVGRSTSVLLKPHCLRAPHTLATPVARRLTLPTRGLWKQGRVMA